MKVLLVDDTPVNIDVLSGTLRPLGYQMAVANSGEKALKVAEKFVPDLILLDVMMPGMDGFATCEALKKNPALARIPVIFITARVDPGDLDEGFRVGAVDYIAKPFRDSEVRARVKTHLSLKHAQDGLLRLNTEKDRFLGMAAHDLRSPLSGMRGFLEIVREEGAAMDAVERDDMLQRVLNATTDMLGLVNDLLDVTSIASGKVTIDKARSDLATLVSERVGFVRFAAERKQISIDTLLPKGLMVPFDSRRISQVLDNLLTNAVKFSPAGSCVRVTARQDDRCAEVQVMDEGPGLSPADVEKLFADFQKLSARPTAGEASTGLGLAIARRVVDAHGGSIYGRNGQPRGALFGFTLPMHEG